MAERYLDVIRPSPEQLCQWGYDDDLYLTSQDEDLLLHDVACLPVLIELAADPSCPKQFYAASIAYTYSQLCVLHKRRAEVEAISVIVEAIPPSAEPLVVEWRGDFRWICDRLQRPRALSADMVNPKGITTQATQHLSCGKRSHNSFTRAPKDGPRCRSVAGEGQLRWKPSSSIRQSTLWA